MVDLLGATSHLFGVLPAADELRIIAGYSRTRGGGGRRTRLLILADRSDQHDEHRSRSDGRAPDRGDSSPGAL